MAQFRGTFPSTLAAGQAVYQVKIKGRLPGHWVDWFEGLDIAYDDGDTLLTGPVADQAALFGLLLKLRDLGLTLISVYPAGRE